MLLSQLSDKEIATLMLRVQAGERVFFRAVVDYCGIEKDSIVELHEVTRNGLPGALRSTVYGRPHRHKMGSYLQLDKFELAPQATKTWSPAKPKVVKPVLADPEVFDGLGQEVRVGDYLALVDNGKMRFSRYTGFKGVNTLLFVDTNTGENFRRMPSELHAGRRTCTFDHSLKIRDQATLNRMVIHKLAR